MVRNLRVHPSDPRLTVFDEELLAEAARQMESELRAIEDRARRGFASFDAENRECLESITPAEYILTWRGYARGEYASKLRERRTRRRQLFLGFIRDRGRRYASCRLRNFRANLPEQKAALKAILAYDHDMLDRVECGSGLLLYGSIGTGKDHILCALARRAILFRGIRVTWTNGADLERTARESITSEAATESLNDLKTTGGVLVLSDPCPGGSPTPFQLAALTEVLDFRYSHKLATWVAINASTRTQLEETVSARIADRIIDGAVVVPMVWPSYRKRLA